MLIPAHDNLSWLREVRGAMPEARIGISGFHLAQEGRVFGVMWFGFRVMWFGFRVFWFGFRVFWFGFRVLGFWGNGLLETRLVLGSRALVRIHKAA